MSGTSSNPPTHHQLRRSRIQGSVNTPPAPPRPAGRARKRTLNTRGDAGRHLLLVSSPLRALVNADDIYSERVTTRASTACNWLVVTDNKNEHAHISRLPVYPASSCGQLSSAELSNVVFTSDAVARRAGNIADVYLCSSCHSYIK